jgi:hypothetical protein
MCHNLLKYCFFPVITSLLICNISCKKITTSLTDTAPKTFDDVFEQYWNKMSVNYVYWDVDTTNWDNVYKKYKPLFSGLDLNNVADIRKSVSYFKDMSKGLIDAHYYISFTPNSIVDSFVYPAYERKKNEMGFHAPYAFYKVDTSYLDANFQLGIDNNYFFGNQPLVVLYGTISNKILYFSCNHFELSKAYYSTIPNKIQPVLNSFFNTLDNPPSNIKGLIIDVRSNYGGDLGDLNFLVGRFVNKPQLFGYTQYKCANGKFDFTPWLGSYISPQSNVKLFSIPIAILADNISASLSEAVIMAVKPIPHSVFIGETTFGATGPITENDTYNDGSFVIASFLKVQTSSAKFKYVDGKIYEGIGIPPDIISPFNFSALQSNTDPQLEKAIDVFR